MNELYRNGLAYGNGLTRAYGFRALMLDIARHAETWKADFSAGVIDAALFMVSNDPRLGVTRS